MSQNKGKTILLGNEAIVRGALESGVQFVATYPGTPASEIGNQFFKMAKSGEYKGYFEFSTNEKVALEAGIGASFSGLKTLVAMKNFGLNVCLDSLLPFVYTGSKGPTVMIVADDPSCHSSAQTEQNTRPIDNMAHIPILEPADPQECRDFVKLGFEISEKFNIPVIIRTTTRVAHQRALVKLGVLPVSIAGKGNFVKNPKQFVTLPPRVLEMKKELLEKIEGKKGIREFSEKSEVNKIEGKRQSKIGIITSGVSYLYAKEALKELNMDLPILKIGIFHPAPKRKIKSFIKGLKKVLVAEELEGLVEDFVKGLAKDANCKLEIHGKDLLPTIGELKPEYLMSAIAKIANVKYKPQTTNHKIQTQNRSPQFCPGCPYWLVFSGIKKAVDQKEIIFGGDIGCYMLFGTPAVNMQDYLFSMGSSIGIAHGIKKSTNQKLIAFIGDSTFFHAGIPALINTIFNKSNPLIIILDNMTTGMTGHQPNPSASVVPGGVKIEDIVLACGVKNMKIVDPVNQEEFVNTVKEFLSKDEVSVIISRHPCIFAKKY